MSRMATLALGSESPVCFAEQFAIPNLAQTVGDECTREVDEEDELAESSICPEKTTWSLQEGKTYRRA